MVKECVTHKEMSDEMMTWSEKIRKIAGKDNDKRDERILAVEKAIQNVITQLASFESIKQDIKDIKEALESLVTNKEFNLVKTLVYGFVGVVLLGTASVAGAAIVYFLSNTPI